MARWVANFLRRESGATAVEYAVGLAVTVAVFAAATTAMNAGAKQTFRGVSGQVGTYGSDPKVVIPAK